MNTMTNKTNTVEELEKDILKVLAENSEEPEDVLKGGTLTSFRPEYIVNDLVFLFNQYADSKFNKALPDEKDQQVARGWTWHEIVGFNKALEEIKKRWEEESK